VIFFATPAIEFLSNPSEGLADRFYAPGIHSFSLLIIFSPLLSYFFTFNSFAFRQRWNRALQSSSLIRWMPLQKKAATNHVRHHKVLKHIKGGFEGNLSNIKVEFKLFSW